MPLSEPIQSIGSIHPYIQVFVWSVEAISVENGGALENSLIMLFMDFHYLVFCRLISMGNMQSIIVYNRVLKLNKEIVKGLLHFKSSLIYI